ncbi:MAG: replicative DNA helicase [Opitutales bacterium]
MSSTKGIKPGQENGRKRNSERDGAGAGPSPLSLRLPPHSTEAEEGLLACCILDAPEIISRCMEARLSSEAFYVPAHQVLFEALCEIYEKRAAVDEIILAEELRNRQKLDEIGGYPFINQITNRVETTAHANHFLDIVREKHALRRIIRSSTGAIEKCFNFEGELDQFLEEVEQDIFRISEDRVSDSSKPISESVREAYTLVQKLLERKGELSGITSGFIELDKITNGFHAQEMIVLAARPSMGKTSFALNMAEAAILPRPVRKDRKAVPTLVFSLEMSSSQLAMRMLCGLARVSLIRLRDGISSPAEKQALLQAADELSKAPLWLDDSGQLTILELRAKARRISAQHKLGLVIIDYLQLIAGTDSRVQREQQVAEISRGLKAMAKELNVPVIVLSQLNRDSEKEKRQPRLSDLRESGSIEQDADVVMLLARPKEAGDEHSVAADEADLIIAKQRNGPVGNIKLTFIKNITRFENHTSQSV